MNIILSEFYRMFIGPDFDILFIFEVMFRTAFMYLYTIANVRLMDTRSMGMLSPFEIIIIVALGSAVGDPMFYRQVPLLATMIVITTIVFIERVLTKFAMRSVWFERVLNGRPVLIIKDGQLMKENMAAQNITKLELYSILRQKGVLRISEVEYAYLEPAGSISIIKQDGGSDFIPGKQ